MIIQSPNFFGIVENVRQAAEMAHAQGALLVFLFRKPFRWDCWNLRGTPTSWPASCSRFAIAPSYGGPFAGILACKEKFIRQLPGRLVGETKDSNGNRAFCLTLATREQHIRREKATSNICTNQALIALMATVFMTIYGKAGAARAGRTESVESALSGREAEQRFSGPFFNEFVGWDGRNVGRR